MARIKIPKWLRWSERRKRKMDRAWKQMIEDHRKYSELMGRLARQILKGVEDDNHTKG